MSKAPTVKLNNGRDIPVFGLGTWKRKPGKVNQAVKDAIDAGYRHIDCARYYLNEAEVGAALKEKIDSGVVKREDIFITSKVWPNTFTPDLVEKTINDSLKDLGLEYLDLYLIHWPCALKQGTEFLPMREDGSGLACFGDIDYVDAWKALERVCKKGLTKSIGVSNFSTGQLERILKVAKIRPVINQVECHPYLNQKELIAFCKSKDIIVTAYSPLASPDRPWAKPTDPVLIEEPKIKQIALKHNKSSVQVILRFLFQFGVIPIPKSVIKSRIIENINIFDFQLSQEDMAVLESFECNGRVCYFVEAKGHPHHPFVDEYQAL